MLSAQQTQQQISPSAHLSESTAPPRACIMQLLIFPTQASAAEQAFTAVSSRSLDAWQSVLGAASTRGRA
eukprot:2678374-Prymnesium_polylepis.1